jgi:hypothetical protein
LVDEAVAAADVEVLDGGGIAGVIEDVGDPLSVGVVFSSAGDEHRQTWGF